MVATKDTFLMSAMERSRGHAEIMIAAEGTPYGADFRSAGSTATPTFRSVGETRRTMLVTQQPMGVEANFVRELDAAKRRIELLEREVARLKGSVSSVESLEEHEPIDYELAKAQIADLFAAQGKLTYSEIIQELQLDLDTVIRACDELVAEGRIRER